MNMKATIFTSVTQLNMLDMREIFLTMLANENRVDSGACKFFFTGMGKMNIALTLERENCLDHHFALKYIVLHRKEVIFTIFGHKVIVFTLGWHVRLCQISPLGLR